MSTQHYIGLISGTSVDGIDCALCATDDNGTRLLHSYAAPIPSPLKRDIEALSHAGDNEIDRLGELDRKLGELFSKAALTLLTQSGYKPEDITAIGSHGQTVRHRPPSSGYEYGFTVQIGDPNTIAEHTGITTVADFRRRDMAAGGEGAPLAPAFHQAVFGKEGEQRAIVNIGGFANISLLDGQQLIKGFDSGPGNNLLDLWVAEHLGKPFDEGGNWAASGSINHALLDSLLSDHYFKQKGVRSTGKEAFNRKWLDSHLSKLPPIAPQDVQNTLIELTASSICNAIKELDAQVNALYVCGGGAHNAYLLARIEALLPDSNVQTTETLGVHPDWVEATAFAWFAHRTLNHQASNAPQVTGAAGCRVLGGVYFS